MNLVFRDKKNIWHPFSQEKISNNIAITHGKGSYVYDENNRKYLDLISSWWVTLHGHAHPKIAKSIYTQARKLEQIIFAGFTHEPAVLLSENLLSILPDKLTRCFFSDNGSTAVEVALKMSYQFWKNKGENNRKIFLSLDRGYHGDTFGAMSVGAKSGFHDVFSDLFFRVITIPYPEYWDCDDTVFDREQKSLNKLDACLQKLGDQIAAVILEPLVQGASGMRRNRPEFINQLVSKVKQYGILIIFDEVMTGFGRTGSTFALSQTQVIPDFLCLSKGLTGGFMPLSITITTEEIYNTFLSDTFINAFCHGHSYTANPLACAAAITSLELLNEEKCKNAIKNINKAHTEGMSFLKLQLKDKITKTRTIGTISAFELASKKFSNEVLKSYFFDEGLILRPLNNTIYMIPPYSTSTKDIEIAYRKIEKVISKVT